MKLRDEYASVSDKETDKKDKKVISDDAFAICDFLEVLINRLEKSRISILTKK